VPEMLERAVTVEEVIEKAKELIQERINSKKKPLKVHENIVNGVSNKEYDGDFYEINRKLVDLSEPMLTEEAKETMDSMMHTPMDPEGRSFSNIYRYIHEDGISELYDESKFSTFFSSFKPLIKRETERFEKMS
jgi:translation elongation factor EF-Ts